MNLYEYYEFISIILELYLSIFLGGKNVMVCGTGGLGFHQYSVNPDLRKTTFLCFNPSNITWGACWQDVYFVWPPYQEIQINHWIVAR